MTLRRSILYAVVVIVGVALPTWRDASEKNDCLSNQLMMANFVTRETAKEKEKILAIFIKLNIQWLFCTFVWRQPGEENV